MAERFTQIKAAFDLFDRNMDGYQQINFNSHTSMIAMVDSDGDGAINFEEFSMLMELKPNGVDSDEEMTRAFRMFDMDKDGFISEAELCHIMYNLGSNLSGDEVKEMMRVADTDGDGRLSYEEFKQIMDRI
ncbi:calmodulin [Setaria viridis]|uniref:calmodulin n=1 Tax=Setaria viridis TaxID=4556 RepID=UPI001493DB53|nr:calmodulin-like [Setaria viridis]